MHPLFLYFLSISNYTSSGFNFQYITIRYFLSKEVAQKLLDKIKNNRFVFYHEGKRYFFDYKNCKESNGIYELKLFFDLKNQGLSFNELIDPDDLFTDLSNSFFMHYFNKNFLDLDISYDYLKQSYEFEFSYNWEQDEIEKLNSDLSNFTSYLVSYLSAFEVFSNTFISLKLDFHPLILDSKSKVYLIEYYLGPDRDLIFRIAFHFQENNKICIDFLYNHDNLEEYIKVINNIDIFEHKCEDNTRFGDIAPSTIMYHYLNLSDLYAPKGFQTNMFSVLKSYCQQYQEVNE